MNFLNTCTLWYFKGANVGVGRPLTYTLWLHNKASENGKKNTLIMVFTYPYQIKWKKWSSLNFLTNFSKSGTFPMWQFTELRPSACLSSTNAGRTCSVFMIEKVCFHTNVDISISPNPLENSFKLGNLFFVIWRTGQCFQN